MKNFLHHLLLPRHSNNHRPRLLHLEVLLIVIAFLSSSLIVFAGVEKQYPAVLGDSANISITDLLSNTNLKRAENGLVPLKLNNQLNKAADEKAHHMFAKDYWAHVAPDGTTPWVFIKDSGYQYLYAGENLARGFDDSSDVVEAWMNSPTHRENMLSPNYKDIGFAVLPGTLGGSDTILVVQMFGSEYKTKEQSAEKQDVAIAMFTPTPSVSQFGTGAVALQPTTIPSPTQGVAVGSLKEPTAYAGVAAVQNQPLLDTTSVKRNMSFFFLLLFIGILVIDAIIIERKKIVRAFSHNVDHILFLLFILLAGIIIGRGAIV